MNERMLRNVDVFVKPRADLRSKSAVGGMVTLIAASAAVLLFCAQLYVYIGGTTEQSLHLAPSRAIPMLPNSKPNQRTQAKEARLFELNGKMPVKLHITFPYLPCNYLDVQLDGAPLQRSDFDPSNRKRQVEKRTPTTAELLKAGIMNAKTHKGGCTLRTTLRVPIVAGHITISMTPSAWTEAAMSLMVRQAQGLNEDDEDRNSPEANRFNISHYIHSITFGTPFPLQAKGNNSPLENRAHVIKNNMGGIALESIQVKLVPTLYQGMFSSQDTYQYSVVTHTVQPETLVAHGVPLLPGLSLNYDLTPLAVHHKEGRDPFLVFLSSLVSIVGGVFVTVGLFAGCVAHSAQAVAKKMD